MQKRIMLVLAILLLTIGFASVATTLVLNGTLKIGDNQADFDVYFSKAIENGTENNTLIRDKTSIVFNAEMSTIQEHYILDYEITNGSKQYDANITITCPEGNEYISVENILNVIDPLNAGETRKGKLTLILIKPVTDEMEITITLEIKGYAIERTELGNEKINAKQDGYLKKADNSSTVFLGQNLNKSKVETITLLDSNEVPENAIMSWDVSAEQTGSVMAYTLDENINGLLELYIGQNGGVIANSDSSNLFSNFTNVTNINGLENLNTSGVTNMMGMFSFCANLTILDISNFDTSNVTNMHYMFGSDDYMSLTEIKGIENIDVSNVTDMGVMFQFCDSLTSLDLSKWNTSRVTNMSTMFNGCYNLVTLDVSNFDTSNVTNMENMFFNCISLIDLNLSSFDTSNVTNMISMFTRCKKLKTTINIKGNNCTEYGNMFDQAATETGAQITINYTADAESLVDKMIATKSNNSNVVKGSIIE